MRANAELRHVRLLALSIVLAAALLAAAAQPAHAYRLHGIRVAPGPTVTYSSSLTRYRTPLKRAVNAINRVHAGVRLVAAPRSRATILIGSLGPSCRGAGTRGQTSVDPGRAFVLVTRGCSSRLATVLLAHELLHALGLAHEDRRCALMNTFIDGDRGGIPAHCPSRRYDWARRPLRTDDVRGLRAFW